jgi:hypothetical protein
MTTPDQDLYFQYSDGRDLLAVTLVEREHLLQELGALTAAAQGIGVWRITRFDVTHAQSLLYRLSVVTEAIDSLIESINDYAERGGFTPVECTEIRPK